MDNDQVAIKAESSSGTNGKRRSRRHRGKRQRAQRQPVEQAEKGAVEETRSPTENTPIKEQRGKKKKDNENGVQNTEKNRVEVTADGENKPKRRWRRNKRPKKQNDRATTVPEEKRRQIPAMNLVSSLKPKITLVQYRPPPYTCLPPRHCDPTKMTIVKLTNVDAGVDMNGSLLFWAFKHYGWIDNVYVVPRSFYNRQSGVAFIGFRSDLSAAQAVKNSGNEQLFGRRIFVTIYANRRPKPHFMDLDPNVLVKIFEKVDWRTRIRCESVCRRFNTVLKQMYEKRDYWGQEHTKDWAGLADKIGFIFVAEAPDSDEAKKDGPELVSTESAIVVRVPADSKGFNDMLRGILRKFHMKIGFLDFRNVVIDSDTVHMMNSGGMYVRSMQTRWDAGRIRMKGCVLNDIFVEEIFDMMNYYGDRLSVED